MRFSSRNIQRLINSLEMLEDRLTPLVGQYAALAPAPPGDPLGGTVIAGEFLGAPRTSPNQGYDGVVKLDFGGQIGTGTLFALGGSNVAFMGGQARGHQILTAAHVLALPGDPLRTGTATFEMFRLDQPQVGPPALRKVPITIPIAVSRT